MTAIYINYQAARREEQAVGRARVVSPRESALKRATPWELVLAVATTLPLLLRETRTPAIGEPWKDNLTEKSRPTGVGSLINQSTSHSSHFRFGYATFESWSWANAQLQRIASTAASRTALHLTIAIGLRFIEFCYPRHAATTKLLDASYISQLPGGRALFRFLQLLRQPLPLSNQSRVARLVLIEFL